MRTKIVVLVAFLAVSCATYKDRPEAGATPGATRRYTVLMSTNPAGSQVVTTRGDEVTVNFEYNDRGRGPKTHTVMRLDERSVPVSLVTTGNDYYKVAIEERLSVANGTATWKNTAESGQAQSTAFYSSVYAPPEESAILARAALKAGGKLPVLPGGEATVRKVGEATVRGTHVTAYEIGGLYFQPFEIWLDDDLNFFGSVGSWSSTIREGYEAEAKQLIDAQDARSKERVGQLAARLTHVPANNRLAVTNARIFDPVSGTVSAPATIAVEGDRIVSVGAGPAQGEVLDAQNRIVIPGLWDVHVHTDETGSMMNIASGITSARDLANDVDAILALREKINSGQAIGPRLVLAGLVDGRGPYQAPTNIQADTEEEGRKWIDYFVERGYEGLKLYSSMKPELVPVLAKYAHERGLRVSGHIPAGMTASQAIDAGYDEIQHINMLFLNFWPDVKETRTPARFTEVAKRAADIDIKSAEVQAFIKKLRDHNIAVDPTVTGFEVMFTARAGTLSPSFAMIADRLPPSIRRSLLSGGLPVPEGMDERYRASFRKMLDFIGEMHRAGVTIMAGTDDLPGFTLHRELELYVQAGIPPVEVLRLATLTPARVLNREKDLGTIAPGKLADFVLLDGDPTVNISDVRRVVTVVKGGRVFDPAEIWGVLGVRRQ